MNPTSNWERVGTEFYKTSEGSSLEWDLDLAHVHTATSLGGGLVAVWDRTDEIRQGTARKQQIRVFDGSGRLQLSIPWDAGAILGAGFVQNERLVVVSSLGHVRTYYDLRGNFELCVLDGPLGVQFGVQAVVELEDSLVLVDGSQSSRLPKHTSAKANWVPQARNGSTEIIWYGEGTNLPEATHVVPSVDGSLVAVREAQGGSSVRVYDADLALVKVEMAWGTPESTPKWIGTQGLAEIVARHDELELVVHDLSGAKRTLYFDPEAALISELDGLRVLTNETHNFFQKVPRASVQIFMLGSNAPASVLMYCTDQEPREALGLVGDLSGAVSACLEAATFEMDARTQKRLLRAAHFGKTSLEVYDSSSYLRTLDSVRVANTLRQHDVLCTVGQLEHIGARGVVEILTRRSKWEVALGVAKLLRLPTEAIPIAWACATIAASELDDDALAAVLDAKLAQFDSLSYIQIGQTAFDEGRIQLAKQLVAREPSAAKRVGLLLEMGEDEGALRQAVASGSTNLVYYALLRLSKKLSLPQFYRLFSDETSVQCWQYLQPPAKLREFNYQLDRQQDDFRLELRLQLAKPDPKLLKSVKANGYAKHALGDYIKLLELQIQLGTEFNTSFKGLSAVATLAKLLEFGQVQRVAKLQSTLKVDDKQVWWLRVREFAARRDWDGLWQFAQAKKSPIGYVPFWRVCVEGGAQEAAEGYLGMMSDAQRAEIAQA